MKTQDLKNLLLEKGFKEEKQDTGYNYTKIEGHVRLVCYIEPNIDIAFIATYHWNSNEIKGTYSISQKEMMFKDYKVSSLFKKTLDNMPQYIGDPKTGINVHTEVRNAINTNFQE